MQIQMAATRADYERLFQAIEAHFDLKYVLLPDQKSPDLLSFDSAVSLPGLGISKTGIKMPEDQYRIVKAKTEVTIRKIVLDKGGFHYAVNNHPSHITFRSGGLFENRCLTTGFLAGDSDDAFASAVMKRFKSEIKKQFECVNKSLWLGPEALRLFEGGMRCTHSMNMPAIYDLTR